MQQCFTAVLPALRDKCRLTHQVIHILYPTTLTVIRVNIFFLILFSILTSSLRMTYNTKCKRYGTPYSAQSLNIPELCSETCCQDFNFFKLLINICCVIDVINFYIYCNKTGWLLFKKKKNLSLGADRR